MSKLIVGLIAFSCLFTIVAAAATSNITQIEYSAFSDNACTQLIEAYNITSGECTENYVSYYPATDNVHVISYTFAKHTTGCPVANITSVIKFQAGVCGATINFGGSTFTMYHIFTSAVNPAPPTPFPPVGFTFITQYLNLTTAMPADTCDTTRTVLMASPPAPVANPCQKYDLNFSYQSFLDESCTTFVTAYYSDTSCTNSNVERVSIQSKEFKACVDGIFLPCEGSGIPSFPSTLSIGFEQYDNNECITNIKTSEIVSTNGGCYDGQTITCGMVNATQMATITRYANGDCTGVLIDTFNLPTDSCVNNAHVANLTVICSTGPPIIPTASSSSSSTGGTVLLSSSTGSGGVSSSTGPTANSVDLGRSVSIDSIMIGLIVGWMMIKMNK